MNGILAAKNQPVEFSVLQVAESVIKLTEIVRWLDAHHGQQDRLGAVGAQSLGNGVRKLFRARDDHAFTGQR